VNYDYHIDRNKEGGGRQRRIRGRPPEESGLVPGGQ